MKSETVTDIPHPRNFCGGNFKDWLEVMLTDKCNGSCSWCIEKGGFHPTIRANVGELLNKIFATRKKNILLLGGEPTLYPDLDYLINYLAYSDKNVYLTTNGSRLTKSYINTLLGLNGINISIHHYSFDKNKEITGIQLPEHPTLRNTLLHLPKRTKIRLNCNCIKGYIDSEEQIRNYIEFAKSLGADSVRFAELKLEEDNFVDLAKVLNHKYGLNDDPFHLGCNTNTRIKGMPINFRQMCGLQTTHRPRPENPPPVEKSVLYYDGKLYNGWQRDGKENEMVMNREEIDTILLKVKKGEISVKEAAKLIDEKFKYERRRVIEAGSGCRY